MVKTCIVHLVRHSLNFCSWKDRKALAADLRRICSAPTADMAEAELDAFDEKWAGKYASIAPAWRRARTSYAGKWVTGFEKAAYRGGC